jgi:Fe-S-cluster containining protein
VIFARGELSRGDDAESFRALGFKLRQRAGGIVKFAQPCPALDCGACRVYETRPHYCREFDCALLKRVIAGDKSPETALRSIAMAKRLATKADRLLRKLGANDSDTALALRFRRLNRRLETESLESKLSHTFSDLTVTMHKLNMLLSAEFYPGS